MSAQACIFAGGRSVKLTYRTALQLLPPGDTVYSLAESGGGAEPAEVLEVCDGWLETSVGILDFDDHGQTWWLTRRVAEEMTKGR